MVTGNGVQELRHVVAATDGCPEVEVLAPRTMGRNDQGSWSTPECLLEDCGRALALQLEGKGVKKVTLRIQPYQRGNNQPAGWFRKKEGTKVHLTFPNMRANGFSGAVDVVAIALSESDAATIKQATFDKSQLQRPAPRTRRSQIQPPSGQGIGRSNRAVKRGRVR